MHIQKHKNWKQLTNYSPKIKINEVNINFDREIFTVKLNYTISFGSHHGKLKLVKNYILQRLHNINARATLTRVKDNGNFNNIK